MRETPKTKDLTDTLPAETTFLQRSKNDPGVDMHLLVGNVGQKEKATKNTMKLKHNKDILFLRDAIPAAQLRNRSHMQDRENPSCQKLYARPVNIFAHAELLKTPSRLHVRTILYEMGSE